MYGTATPDRLVDALRTCIRIRANAALATTWAESGATFPPVVSDIGSPVIRTNLPHEQLPMLAVVRQGTDYAWSGKQRDRLSHMVIEWWGVPTAAERVRDAWPTMAAVSEAFVSALDGIVDGVNVIGLAGGLDVVEETIKIAYNYVTAESEAWPFFQLRVDIRHTASGTQRNPLAGSDPLLELRARYLLDGLTPSEQPLIETLTRTAEGTAAAIAGDLPVDPNFIEGFPA